MRFLYFFTLGVYNRSAVSYIEHVLLISGIFWSLLWRKLESLYGQGKDSTNRVAFGMSQVLISRTYVHMYKYKFSLEVTCGFQRTVELFLINLMLLPKHYCYCCCYYSLRKVCIWTVTIALGYLQLLLLMMLLLLLQFKTGLCMSYWPLP